VTAPRRLLLLLLTVSCSLLAVPSARAAFTRPRAATATFSSTSVAAPVVLTAVRCLLTNTIPVTWTHSTTTFVTSQVVEVSTSPTLATVAASSTFANNTTQSTTIGGLGALSSLVVYYVRVTARFTGWSTPSTVYASTFNALC
jgi:hypothetical protein